AALAIEQFHYEYRVLLHLAPDAFPTRRSSDLKFRPDTAVGARLHTPGSPPGRALLRRTRNKRSSRPIRRFKEVICYEKQSLVPRSEEHMSELQSRFDLVCRLLLEKKISYTFCF